MTETTTCYRIAIPNFWPYRLNQTRGRHWSIEAKLKRIDHDLIWAYSRGIPTAHGPRSVKLILTLGPRQRGPDVDALWKGLLDNLVQLELLIDDSRKWCKLEPIECTRGPAKATTIELRDLEVT